jgi:hypothetical protein
LDRQLAVAPLDHARTTVLGTIANLKARDTIFERVSKVILLVKHDGETVRRLHKARIEGTLQFAKQTETPWQSGSFAPYQDDLDGPKHFGKYVACSVRWKLYGFDRGQICPDGMPNLIQLSSFISCAAPAHPPTVLYDFRYVRRISRVENEIYLDVP